VDFTNTVIIMTSNIGSQYLKAAGGADDPAVREQVLKELDRHFRPEFLNRLDEIILFHSLRKEHLLRIVDIQIERLARLLAERNLTINLSDAARAFLAERGYDPVFGARPLKRTIQRELQDPLAQQILEGALREGDHIWVDVDPSGERLVFQAVAPEAVAS